MAISYSVDWEVRTTGAATNGGGYNRLAGTTDYSQQDTAQVAVTDAVANGTTTITSATANFTSAMVGNIIYLAGGTGSLAATRREITAYTNSTTITVDATVATGTGITLNLGGAVSGLIDITVSGLGPVGGNNIYLKAATYSRTSAITMSITGSTTLPIQIISYDTTRTEYNTDSTRALITTATNSVALIQGNASSSITYKNIDFTSTAVTKTVCFGNTTTASNALCINCYFSGFTSLNPNSTNSNLQYTPELWFCEVTNCSTFALIRGNSSSMAAYFTYFHDTYGGFVHSQSSGSFTAFNCIFDTLTNYAISFTRTTTSQPGLNVQECVFYNCDRAFSTVGNTDVTPSSFTFMNNIVYGGTYGLISTNNITKINMALYDTNAFGNQSTAARSNVPAGNNEITLTANPFVDAANGNFNLNTTSGGGALLRALSLPQSFKGSATSNYRDIGASQHEDSGGGATEQSFSG